MSYNSQSVTKYFIKTYGCQANKNESERQAGYYESQGLQLTTDWRDATEIFINTCSVRKAADDRVYSLLNQMTKFFAPKRKKPTVILTGCMARYGQKLLDKYPIITQLQTPSTVSFAYPTKRQDKTQAFIQISVGCNSFCTYCVVPYARGRERARSFEEIMREVQTVVDEGYHEITLLGQNVNSWGMEQIPIAKRKQSLRAPSEHVPVDLAAKDVPFVKLLQAISAIPAVTKIRFLTSNPWDFYDELVAEIGRNSKIDRYLHLPVQSGSNSVLSRMNRGYTREDYLRLITKLRAIDPTIQIGTDIIVGFANETEAEFQETVKLVKEANFIIAFVAIYSVRVGTVAAKIYQDTLPYQEKKRRFELLDQLINRDQLAQRPKIV